MTRILAFGKSETTVERGLALLRAEGYEAQGVRTAGEAIAVLMELHVDVLVIGGGVGSSERAAVKDAAHRLVPAPKVVEVHGAANLLKALRPVRQL